MVKYALFVVRADESLFLLIKILAASIKPELAVCVFHPPPEKLRKLEAEGICLILFFQVNMRGALLCWCWLRPSVLRYLATSDDLVLLNEY